MSSYENQDELYSRPVRAGKRTYFFDVKATRGKDLYMTCPSARTCWFCVRAWECVRD